MYSSTAVWGGSCQRAPTPSATGQGFPSTHGVLGWAAGAPSGPSGLHGHNVAQRGRARTTCATRANGSAGWTPSRRRGRTCVQCTELIPVAKSQGPMMGREPGRQGLSLPARCREWVPCRGREPAIGSPRRNSCESRTRRVRDDFYLLNAGEWFCLILQFSLRRPPPSPRRRTQK